MKSRFVLRICAVVLLIVGFTHFAIGFEKPAHRSISEIDKRQGGPRQELSPKQAAGLRKLQARSPDVRVDVHQLHGSPQWVRVPSGFLTEGNGVLGPAVVDAASLVKGFVTRNAELFGHDAAAL